MEIVREFTQAHHDYWAGAEGIIIKGDHIPGVENCAALVDMENTEIHIAWKPDEIDIARLAHGGTIWLTTIGGLPPHRIEVQDA